VAVDTDEILLVEKILTPPERTDKVIVSSNHQKIGFSSESVSIYANFMPINRYRNYHLLTHLHEIETLESHKGGKNCRPYLQMLN
jgi:hypothetical protein